MKRLFTLLLLLTVALPSLAQEILPLIKAKSTSVSIKDDNQLRENAWRVVPTEKLDIYSTSAKKVTFYTDIDSISFVNDAKKSYDFIILLNGRDSARTRVEFVPSKLEILRAAADYNYSDQRFVPKFAYQAADAADLQRLRQELKLDSIAGEGTQLSKVFNLLHWLHNLIRHDGGSSNPTSKNAVDMIQLCKAESRGVNCRMLASILNECYLSLGIKSRFLTCMPRETQFDDCHVINMVYVDELKKWIWIDPSFDAYVMDDKGNLLGPGEVRERLIKGLPLILNPDANWNREALMTKEHYLETYMAKNLYRLEAPIVSEYNAETWQAGKHISYLELLPLDGIEQSPQVQEHDNGAEGVKFTHYKTNNPDLFWAKPE